MRTRRETRSTSRSVTYGTQTAAWVIWRSIAAGIERHRVGRGEGLRRDDHERPAGLAVDQAADKIIVASFNDASVTLINGDTCNATDTTGCARTPPKKPTGSGPFWVAAGGPAGTAYVSVSNRNELAVLCTGR